jgi:hypothetical protein
MGVLRIILGVIGGYAGMALLIAFWAFVVVPMIWPELAMVDGEFPKAPLDHPGFVWELPVNLLAGLLGGLACGLIAGKGRRLSATILVALMIAGSIPALFYTEVKPLWATIAAPVFGGAGIFTVVLRLNRQQQPAN